MESNTYCNSDAFILTDKAKNNSILTVIYTNKDRQTTWGQLKAIISRIWDQTRKEPDKSHKRKYLRFKEQEFTKYKLISTQIKQCKCKNTNIRNAKIHTYMLTNCETASTPRVMYMAPQQAVGWYITTGAASELITSVQKGAEPSVSQTPTLAHCNWQDHTSYYALVFQEKIK